MGYSTGFTGELRFTTPLSAAELAEVKKYLGADCREHPEWETVDLSYIDLEFNDDFTGLRWDGSEKTYDLHEKVNTILIQVRKKFPDFGLEGVLQAQGEDFDDRWRLVIENGRAEKVKVELKGKKVKCPHCDEYFMLEEGQ